MTTQILTSPTDTRAEYSLSESERLALLPAPKKLRESKLRLKLLLTKQEIKQVFKDVSNLPENDRQPLLLVKEV
jgi:hypothetical protein